MSAIGIIQVIAIAVFPAAMIAAAVSDIVSMTISNRVTGTLVLAFPVAALATGMPLDAMALHGAVGVAALLAGMAMFAAGWVGGGDAKLFAGVMLWLGPALALPYGLLAALLGGALTIALLTFRQWPLPSALSAQGWALRLHDPKAGVPYGVALAVAGLYVFASSGWAAGLGF